VVVAAETMTSPVVTFTTASPLKMAVVLLVSTRLRVSSTVWFPFMAG
jgi:hypothetical protein